MCNKCVWLWEERPKAKTLKTKILTDWAEFEAEKRVKLIKFKLCTISRLLSLLSYLCKNNNPNWSDSTNNCAFFFSTRRKIAFRFCQFRIIFVCRNLSPHWSWRLWKFPFNSTLQAKCKMNTWISCSGGSRTWEQKFYASQKQILFANFLWEIFAIYF